MAALQVRLENARSEAPLSPIPVKGFVLRKDERAYYTTTCSLFEHKTVSHTVGGYGGVSFRVMKGVRINTGSYRGQRISETVAQQTDRGTLCVTDRRLIFIGAAGNRDIPYDKIIGLEASPTNLVVQVSNRKPLCFVADGFDLSFYVQVVINGHITK